MCVMPSGKVEMMFFLVLILYFSDCFIHLRLQAVRPDDGIDHFGVALTKCALVPLLFLSLVTVSPVAGVRLVSFPLICLVFLFYFLGDVLLCIKKDASFVAGVLSFTAGHVAALVFVLGRTFSLISFFISVFVASAGFALYLKKILSSASPMKSGLVFYGTVLFLFATGAGACFTVAEAVPCAVFVTGVLFFVWSDSRIAYNVAGVRKSTDVSIMTTYIAAITLIAISFFLLSADAAVRVA